MIKLMSNKIFAVNAAVLMGVVSYAPDANAQATGNDFSSIARNISSSIEELPGLVASLAYLVGMLMGVLGVIKIKDHVENPTQTPMKDGAVRLAAGGALFALPIMFESMSNTIGSTNVDTGAATLKQATFNTIP
jgi:hypothetical protein